MASLRSARVLWVLLLCSASAAMAAGLDVPLTVTERSGTARFDEPVTAGVPLPKGLTEDCSALTLLGPDGKPVPAQFTVASRWVPHNSVKWVLVDFQASLPAGGKAVYRLTDAGANPAPAMPVSVSQIEDLATVLTGRLKFVVRRGGFNLLDGVWLDADGSGRYGTQLVAPGKVRVELFHGGTGLAKYKMFTPANDPDVTLAVEENGPMRAVVKLAGKHLSNDDMPGDPHLLDFVCRITAYAGSTRVKVDYSLECKQGDSIAEGVPLDRFWFSLPLELDAASRTWAVGIPGGKYVGPGCDPKSIPEWNEQWEKPEATIRKYFEPGLDDCWVSSENSERVVFRGDFWRKRQPLYCRGKYEKEAARSVGWLDLADATKGLAASIRWFWQTYPRAIVASGNALLVMPHANFSPRPDLLDRPFSRRAIYYPGMSKTSEVLLYFHGPRDVARLQGAHAGLQQPLRAWAPPSWYCEETQAFGRLASSNKSLFDEDTWKLVQQYDANVRGTLDRILVHRDLYWGSYDSYGMFNFGDTIDFIKDQRGDPADKQVTWDNCYYDYPHALMLQWARTGDPDCFDLFEQAEHHLMDLDMVCWHPDPKMIGGNRYCDGTMHIRWSEGGIYVSPSFNHYKTQSHFERYFLTGQRRARDMGVLSATFALNNFGIGFGEPRSLGHGPLGCLAGWEGTGERRFLDRFIFMEKWYMDQVARGARIAKDRHWQGGIGFEGMREYYEHCGDPAALESLKVQVEHCASLGDYSDSSLHAFAFLGAQFDNPAWLKKARDRIGNVGNIKRDWGYGQSFGNQLRNAPYVWWYLTKDLPKTLTPERVE